MNKLKLKQLTLPTYLWASDPGESDGETYIYSPPYMSLILIADSVKYKHLMLNSNVIKREFIKKKVSYTFALWQNNVELTGGELVPQISVDDFLSDAFDWSYPFLDKKEFEIGYTPENLRQLIQQSEATQTSFAKEHEISLRTLQKWLAPVHLDDHRDMPLKKWVKLIKSKKIAK